MPKDCYFLGLDLGRSVDFSALVALRRRRIPDPRHAGRALFAYTVRGIKRWPLGTLYKVVSGDVAQLVSKPPLTGCFLGLDCTGVGAPVVEMVYGEEPQAILRPIIITGGYNVGGDVSCYHVPKRDLVAAVNVLLQSDRLDIPLSLPEAPLLVKELSTFKATITAAGNETFESDWREREHDDLVLALAIACWLGEKSPEAYMGPLVLWPPSPESLAADTDLRAAVEAVENGRKDEAAQHAHRILRNPGALDDCRQEARKVLELCGQEPPEEKPAERPAHPYLGDDRVVVGDVAVDFRDWWNP